MRRAPWILSIAIASATIGGVVLGDEPKAVVAPTPAVSVASIALPGPSPRARPHVKDDIEAQNDKCGACHATIAAEWKGSMHREAWRDPVFQSAYAIEAVAFCRGCHAPEADAAKEPNDAAKHVGVGCTTCHVQGNDVVGAKSVKGAPHGVFVDARMASVDACASCHQFDFPGEKRAMQDTVHEHARGSLASTTCQSCHMPSVAPEQQGGVAHLSHAFSVLKNPAMIRRAITASAARNEANRTVSVTLTPSGAGHSFPTGDMFRRVVVRADVIDDEDKSIARAEQVTIGRTFRDVPRAPGSFAFHRIEASDNRVPPTGGAPRVAELSFGQSIHGKRIRWQVVYQRMSLAMAASFGVDQAIDEVIVAEGKLDAK
jgi:hypothetical protein